MCADGYGKHSRALKKTDKLHSAPSSAPSAVSENYFDRCTPGLLRRWGADMPDDYLNLIDAEDLKLTSDEISAKALALVQSIGLAETEEAGDAIAAKARAYFKRGGAIREPKPDHEPFPFPPISEIRWQARHEGMSWDKIQEEWMALRSKIVSTAQDEWSEEQVRPLQQLCWMEKFTEDFWPDQSEVVDQIRADRMADSAGSYRDGVDR
jgi:hypothetical protein